MEVEQLKKEVGNPRAPVSLLFPFSSLPVPHGAGQEKQWGGGPLQGTRRSRRYLWDGVGCGRRLGFDPTEVHRRQPLHLAGSACPALSRPGPGPVSLTGKNQTLGSGQGTHTPLTPACPFRHSPLWPPPPPCPEACFLGTDQVMAPKQQTRAGTRLYFSQISKTGKEIKNYVEAQAGNDPLLKGIPEDKNPFKEKGACMIS